MIPTKLIKAKWDVFTKILCYENSRSLTLCVFLKTRNSADIAPGYQKCNHSEKGNY